MRFFKSCRIVKRTRAREMLFRGVNLVCTVCSAVLAPGPARPGPMRNDPENPVDPGDPNAPQNEVAYEVVLGIGNLDLHSLTRR